MSSSSDTCLSNATLTSTSLYITSSMHPPHPSPTRLLDTTTISDFGARTTSQTSPLNTADLSTFYYRSSFTNTVSVSSSTTFNESGVSHVAVEVGAIAGSFFTLTACALVIWFLLRKRRAREAAGMRPVPFLVGLIEHTDFGPHTSVSVNERESAGIMPSPDNMGRGVKRRLQQSRERRERVNEVQQAILSIDHPTSTNPTEAPESGQSAAPPAYAN